MYLYRYVLSCGTLLVKYSNCLFCVFLIAGRPLRDLRSKNIKTLPFPVDSGNGHYKPFIEVYGTTTKEV